MPKAASGEGVLALDLGTSSVRAVVYDTRGAMLEKTLTDLPYKVRTTDAGEVSSDPDALVTLIAQSIDGALKVARNEKVAILGVGVSCYWHSLMGVDRAGRPTTELLTWADTSLGEYLYQELHGEIRVSHSIASGTGLLDVNRCQWDAPALRLAGITAEQLSPLSDWDQPARSLRSSYVRRWPHLRDAPWYLALGDGGLANIGAGCVSPRWACATIGTSSALRVLLDRKRLSVPWGTFVYRVDRHRYVLGGALSEGGNVVRWFTDTLGLKPKKKYERAAGTLAPDSHGLTILPFWAGERSPNWRGDARAVIAGLSLGTQPPQLFRGAMEAITYQMVAVAAAMQRVVPRPESVIATGGQLIHSPAWTQMLADALDVRVTTSPEREASSRGAALLALHVLGKLPKLWSSTPARGRSYRPRPAVHARYERGRRRQQQLYELLFRSTAAAGSGSRTKDLRSPGARR